MFRDHPYFTQTGRDREENGDQYIANMRDGAVAGFKYFSFEGASEICMDLSGTEEGKVQVSDSGTFSEIRAELPVSARGKRLSAAGTLRMPDGVRPLYFRFVGTGALDFYGFTLG